LDPQRRVAGRCRNQREPVLQIFLAIDRRPLEGQRRASNLRLHGADRRGCLVDRLTGPQAHHHGEPPPVALLESSVRPRDGHHPDWNDDVDPPPDVRSEELRRHDADDREGNSIERQRPSNRVGGAAEAPLPERVADDDDRSIPTALVLVVGAGERQAEHGHDTKRVEHSRGRPDAVDELGDPAARQVEPLRAPREGAVEELPLLQFAPDRISPGIGPLRGGVGQDREPMRVLDGQRAQDEAVDEREDRGICADPERERQDGDRRHDGRSDQLTDCHAEIVEVPAVPRSRPPGQLEKRRGVQRVERDLTCLLVGGSATNRRFLQIGKMTRELVNDVERELAPLAIGAFADQRPPLPHQPITHTSLPRDRESARRSAAIPSVGPPAPHGLQP